MGWSFRRSFRFGPFRVNLSKSGVGYSVGTRGIRVGEDSEGRRYRSLNIPGTGITFLRIRLNQDDLGSHGRLFFSWERPF
jgi:hypothetical protein